MMITLDEGLGRMKVEDKFAKRGNRGLPLLPGGVGRSTYYIGAPAPYALHGDGYKVWDDRGRELIDANNNFTVLVHGNAHPRIVDAAAKTMREGMCWGIPNAHEWEHAELLLKRLPGMDQIRYTNSGTEAVMTAIRIARANTGRDGCIMTRGGYHGSSDVALSAQGAKESRGVPDGVSRDVTTIPINDVAALEEAIATRPAHYAAIVVDLLPNRAGLYGISAEYFETARALATRHGIVLIVDEVISFRLGYRGLSGEYGVTPDMITTGKLIGGGFPIGAVAGREELMRELDPSRADAIPHAGTFTGNPMSMAAGVESLRLLSPDVIATMNALGDSARRAIASRIGSVGWEVRGRGSLLRPFPKDAPYSAACQQAVWWAAYDRGVLLSPANLVALSSPMTEAVVADLAERLSEAVVEVANHFG
ncbi:MULTISPECIES: aspartate aminotransferase family protein [Paraburkholderia]|uniref:aspartate aminotransferase family protein n=1 Tax=Paraburkholderia TaxID=1822464 RepID=UPI0032183AE2